MFVMDADGFELISLIFRRRQWWRAGVGWTAPQKLLTVSFWLIMKEILTPWWMNISSELWIRTACPKIWAPNLDWGPHHHLNQVTSKKHYKQPPSKRRIILFFCLLWKCMFAVFLIVGSSFSWSPAGSSSMFSTKITSVSTCSICKM